MRRENQVMTPMEEGMTNDGWQMPSPIDTLVHLGAGQCSELEAYLSVKPARLLLVECDPEAATALQARTAKLPNVQVLCNAVAGSAGPVVLYRYNVLGAGSLHPATGLLQLFPGMKPLEELPLEALAPTTLLEPLQLAAQEENLLVIDLPGEELPVLQALWDASTLQLFNQVKLCCGREPLYQGSAPAAQIVQWLGEHGFSLLLEEDSEDADYPCWTLQRNHLQLHNLELAQRLTGLEEQLQQSNQARDEQAKLVGEGKAQLDKLRQEHEEANKQLAEQKSLLEQSSQAKAAQEKLAAEWLAEIQQLSQARDEQAKLVGEGKAQLDKLRQEHEEANKQLAEQKSLLEQSSQAKAAQEKLAAERLAQIQERAQAELVQAGLWAEKETEIAQLQATLQDAIGRAVGLEAQLAEMGINQSLQREEVVKAEAQIELIKDILLRREGL